MPKLFLPIVFRSDTTRRHKVSRILLNFEDGKVVTASPQGELLIWNVNPSEKKLEPKVFLYPSLYQNVGKLTCFTILRKPLTYFTENMESCLVTIHHDNRVRFWSLDDGQCLNISPHFIFRFDEEIVHIKPINEVESRYMACISNIGNLYIFDVWKLRIARTIKISKSSLKLFTVERSIQELILINSSNELLTWNIEDFFSTDVNQYRKYALNTGEERKTKMLKDKSTRLIKLPEAHNEAPLDLLISMDRPLIVVLYPSCLMFIDKEDLNVGKITFHLKLTLSNHLDYKKIHMQSVDSSNYILISTLSGNLVSICYDEILFLWKIMIECKTKALNLSFSHFSLVKESNATSANMTMQGTILIYSKEDKIRIKDMVLSFEDKDFDLSGFDDKRKIYCVYNPVIRILQFFDCSQEILRFVSKIHIINSETSESIMKTEGVKFNYSDGKSFSISERKSIDSGQLSDNYFSSYMKFQFAQRSEYSEMIKPEGYFHRDLPKDVMSKVLSKFKDDERISVSLIMEVDKKFRSLIGTSAGQIFSFPLLLKGDHPIEYLEYQVSAHEITFLYCHRELLFVGDSIGKFLVFYLNHFISEGYKECGGSLRKYNLKSHIITNITLSNPIKRIMIVKNLKEKVEGVAQRNNPSETDVIYGLILENNIICIYSREKKSILCEISHNDHSILGIYCLPEQDYFLVLNNSGDLLAFAQANGRYERSLNLEKHSALFDLPNFIEHYTESYRNKHSYAHYKKKGVSTETKIHSILEFNYKSSEAQINYSKEFSKGKNKKGRKNKYQSKLFWERFGDLKKVTVTPQETGNLLWIIKYGKETIYECKLRKEGVAIFKMKLNTKRFDSYSSVAHIVFFDCKQNSEYLRKKKEEEYHFSFLPFIFPFGVSKEIDQLAEIFTDGHRPFLNFSPGMLGVGEGVSVIIESEGGWGGTSSNLNTLRAVAIMHNLLSHQNKDPRLQTSLIFQLVDCLTKQKGRIFKRFQPLNLHLLSAFALNKNNEIMNSACNLIISALINQDGEYIDSYSNQYDLFITNISSMELAQKNPYSRVELIWITLLGYCLIFMENSIDIKQHLLLRIVNCVNLKHCYLHPNFVGPCLRLLSDGVSVWGSALKEHLQTLFNNLIFIFFHYQSSLEYSSEIEDIAEPSLDNKNMVNSNTHLLHEIANQDIEIRKKIKNLIIKTITALGANFLEDFIYNLKKHVMNTDIHLYYPTTVIDIIRYFVKAQNTVVAPQISNFVDIIMKTLDPKNIHMRKITHNAATKALHLIYKAFSTVTFNQTMQYLGILSSPKTVSIIDLRTASKIKEYEVHDSQVNSICIDKSGKYFASYSIGDSSIRIWSLGNSGIFGSILGWDKKPIKSINVPGESVGLNSLQEQPDVDLEWSATNKQVILKMGKERQLSYDVF